MATAERQFAEMFRALAAQLAADITRTADEAGAIPRSATLDLQRRAAERITALYVGRSRSGELAPFETLTDGRIIPLAPYTRILWPAITAATRLPVEQNAAVLARLLPADLLAVMRRATVDPFAEARDEVGIAEMADAAWLTAASRGVVAGPVLVAENEAVFRPNPLAQYDAPHQWVDPNGYRLSDRIWNTATAERAKLDAYLDDAIKQGKGALAMSKELTQFLDPSRTGIKTNKPYGTKASYDAMRLARTEITRANVEATRVAAAMNPFVAGIQWVLSPRHPKPDICDQYARGGPKGDGVYPIDAVPGVPHPHCLCHRLNVLIDDPDAVIASLRDDIRRARQELVNKIGPVQVDAFDKLLLGQIADPAALPVRPPVLPPVAPPVAPRVVVPPPAPAAPLPTPTPTPAPKVDLTPLKDPNATVIWEKEPLYAGRQLNRVALKEVKPGYWEKVKDKALNEPALPTGQRISTGLVVVEPDGRIWIVAPKDGYGGYANTFPKGGLEAGLTAQQNALKEVWEEAGLRAEITDYLGDFAGTTSTTRYYIAKRTGGAPWLTDDETAAVKLLPLDAAQGLLNPGRDQDILAALRAKLAPAVAVPAPLSVAPGAIPALDELTFVQRLGGSTGAELFQDAAGKRYVVKSGSSNEHIRSEYLADELYRTLGANVPRARLVERDGTTFKIAEFIEGKSLADLKGAALTAARTELQKHFTADALLGSWDVIGLASDNIIVDAAGKAWRIDNGGSLLFRAQGAPKPLGKFLDEVWTLRDKGINGSAAAVFGDMSYGEIATQLSASVSQRSAIMSQITDPNLRSIMAARFDHAEDLAGIYRTLSTDKYVDGYIDRFSYHNTWIQSRGVTDSLSRRLTWTNPGDNPTEDVLLEDENGKRWDNLRGTNGVYGKFLRELDSRTNGRGAAFMRTWTAEQASDSWSAGSRLVRESMVQNRPDKYYNQPLTDPLIKARLKDLSAKYTADEVSDYAAALNALTYETLRKVEVGNRPRPGVLTLIRTESTDVIKRYGIEPVAGSRGQMRRGVLESTSLHKPVVVEGDNVTEQDIPIHRVVGFYGFGTDKTMYLNDRENELLTILNGYESRFVRKARIW